ncbi:MAG: YraN family protein [Proteobacteria bacterium]|nr:YraN family protein [Pseudomonadota bacterium]
MTVTGHQKGLWAEVVAKFYLRLKGYRILDERFKTAVGEIDLIAHKGRQLIFVEVKLRGTLTAAAEAIHAKNRVRVRRAAELYLQRHLEYTGREIRFDAVVLAPNAWPQHIRNAW